MDTLNQPESGSNWVSYKDGVFELYDGNEIAVSVHIFEFGGLIRYWGKTWIFEQDFTFDKLRGSRIFTHAARFYNTLLEAIPHAVQTASYATNPSIFSAGYWKHHPLFNRVELFKSDLLAIEIVIHKDRYDVSYNYDSWSFREEVAVDSFTQADLLSYVVSAYDALGYAVPRTIGQYFG